MSLSILMLLTKLALRILVKKHLRQVDHPTIMNLTISFGWSSKMTKSLTSSTDQFHIFLDPHSTLLTSNSRCLRAPVVSFHSHPTKLLWRRLQTHRCCCSISRDRHFWSDSFRNSWHSNKSSCSNSQTWLYNNSNNSNNSNNNSSNNNSSISNIPKLVSSNQNTKRSKNLMRIWNITTMTSGSMFKTSFTKKDLSLNHIDNMITMIITRMLIINRKATKNLNKNKKNQFIRPNFKKRLKNSNRLKII